MGAGTACSQNRFWGGVLGPVLQQSAFVALLGAMSSTPTGVALRPPPHGLCWPVLHGKCMATHLAVGEAAGGSANSSAEVRVARRGAPMEHCCRGAVSRCGSTAAQHQVAHALCLRLATTRTQAGKRRRGGGGGGTGGRGTASSGQDGGPTRQQLSGCHRQGGKHCGTSDTVPPWGPGFMYVELLHVVWRVQLR